MIAIILFYLSKSLVILLCIASIMICLYSARESYNNNRYNNEDYAGIAMAVLYLGFDSVGITLGVEDAIDSAITMKFFVIIMCLYVIKVSLRNTRLMKELHKDKKVITSEYSGIERRTHLHE